jgi:hypothetical protein
MAQGIREADWKHLRQLYPIALERFCQRVLSEVDGLASETDKSSHERYLTIFKLMKQRDSELGDTFNDLHRSTALRQLACMQFHELLNQDELAGFSAETRDSAQCLVAAWRPRAPRPSLA